MTHRLLKRQLRKAGVTDPERLPTPAEWRSLLERVSRSYQESDDDRYTLERSLDIASTEMRELYESLQRWSETRLAAERDKLAAILTSVGDGLATIDREGCLVSMNPAGQALLGWPEAELAGRALFEEVLDERPEGHVELRELIARGEASREDDAGFRRRDGRRLRVSYVLTPLLAGGEADGAVLVFRDVTAQRQVEETLRRARAEAETANRLKSEFLANMSHEIRTPMNAIIGMTGLLLDTELDPEQREFAETVRTSGAHLLNILDDILDFSKIEAGRLELERIPFELGEMIEDVVGLFAERAVGKGLELVCSFDPGVPARVEGDPGRLRQILANLIGNAIKFTASGEVEIHTGVLDQEAERVVIRVAVRDTGIGVAPAEHATLFEAFSQGDGSTTRRFGGTGLGLAISRQLTELMGGSIGVESAPGHGSRFWFTASLGADAEGLRLLQPQASCVGRRALVVDPHPASLRALMARLEGWGFHVQRAADGAAADGILAGDREELSLVLARAGEAGGHLLSTLAAPDDPALVLLTPYGHRPPADVPPRAVLVPWPAKTAVLLRSIRGAFGDVAVPTAGDRAGERAPHPPTPTESGGPAVVLVAEDNVVNQRVTVRQLERLGYACRVVADGREAVAAATRERYAAVLMDCMMPELDGYDATRAIRAAEDGGPRLPIIAVTANAMAGERQKCLAAGMDDYIAKPISRRELEAVLKKWVKPGDDERGVLDPAVLESLRELDDDGDDFVAEVVELFLRDAPKRIAALRRGFEASAGGAVARDAHTLKGACSNLGAVELRALCESMEAHLRAGALEEAEALLPALEHAYDRLRGRLERDWLSRAQAAR